MPENEIKISSNIGEACFYDCDAANEPVFNLASLPHRTHTLSKARAETDDNNDLSDSTMHPAESHRTLMGLAKNK
jgi:hypothetical protein